jgi:hypothetical protein
LRASGGEVRPLCEPAFCRRWSNTAFPFANAPSSLASRYRRACSRGCGSSLHSRRPCLRESGRSPAGWLAAITCFQNRARGGENASGRMVRNLRFSLHPKLDIAPRSFCSSQTKRFATNESDRFRFHFADVPVYTLRVHECLRSRMAQNDVRDLMKGSFQQNATRISVRALSTPLKCTLRSRREKFVQCFYASED